MARLKPIDKVFDVHGDDVAEFYEIEEGDSFLIRPREHVLLHTMEYIKLPLDLMGFVNLRSSYARIGLTIPPTIIDANFEGLKKFPPSLAPLGTCGSILGYCLGYTSITSKSLGA
jgi:dCTP deaminase